MLLRYVFCSRLTLAAASHARLFAAKWSILCLLVDSDHARWQIKTVVSGNFCHEPPALASEVFAHATTGPDCALLRVYHARIRRNLECTKHSGRSVEPVDRCRRKGRVHRAGQWAVQQRSNVVARDQRRNDNFDRPVHSTCEYSRAESGASSRDQRGEQTDRRRRLHIHFESRTEDHVSVSKSASTRHDNGHDLGHRVQDWRGGYG